MNQVWQQLGERRGEARRGKARRGEERRAGEGWRVPPGGCLRASSSAAAPPAPRSPQGFILFLLSHLINRSRSFVPSLGGVLWRGDAVQPPHRAASGVLPPTPQTRHQPPSSTKPHRLGSSRVFIFDTTGFLIRNEPPSPHFSLSHISVIQTPPPPINNLMLLTQFL